MKRTFIVLAPRYQGRSIFLILMGCVLGLVLMYGATAGESLNQTSVADSDTTLLGLNPQQKKKIDAIFSRFVDKGTPGGAITIIERGKVIYHKGYGLCRLKTRQPITTKSLFHVGSVGKQFTALGIMQLQEDGLLDYDDPIGKYF